MTARCVHGQPVPVDGWGCQRCAAQPQADARAARDRGMAAALDRPAARWDAAVVDQAIRHLARTGREFSVNDVKPLLPAVAGSVIGTRFMVLARRGVIERVGSEVATHAASHARRISVWRGTASPQPLPVPAARQQPDDDRSSRTARETVADKAARLLAAGRVRVRLAGEDGRVVADVQGDSGSYTVRRTATGRWSCPCSAGRYGRRCGHVAAVALVVAG